MIRYLFIALALITFLDSAVEARQKHPCTGKEATVACLKDNFNEIYENSYIQFQMIIGAAENKAASCTSVEDTAAYLDLAPKMKDNPEFEEYFKEFVELNFVKTNPECLLNALLHTGEDTRKIILVDHLRKPLVLTNEEVSKALTPFRTHLKYGEMLKLHFGE